MAMIDMDSGAVRQDPYPAYDAIRLMGPAVPHPQRKLWFVGRYDDAVRVLHNAEVFSNKTKGFETTLHYQDGAQHARMRKLLMQAFSASAIAALRIRLKELTDRLVAQATKRGECEFVNEIAGRVPASTVAWMLGIGDERVDDIRRWSDSILSTFGARTRSPEKRAAPWRLLSANFWRPKVRERSRALESVSECEAFLLENFEQSKRHSGKGWVADLLAGEDSLSVKELADLGVLLVLAGNQTVTDLLSNAALILAKNTSLWDALRADPGLLESFIDEVLRFESPVQRKQRVTTRETRIGDVSLPRGAKLEVLIGAANRDPQRFENADKFQVDRRPNRHIAFSVGPHFCLGAQMAQVQASALFSAMLQQWPNIALSRPEEPIVYGHNLSLRGPRRLHLRWS